MELEKRIEKRAKKVSSDFKNFAFKEATLGAAIGIMMGAAFRDVVNSFVKDILTPPIAFLTSGIDFTKLFWVIGEEKFENIEEALASNATVIYYGNFINEFISFIITALILFILAFQITKVINRSKKKEEEKQDRKEKVCPYCLSEINIKATRCPFCTSKV